MSAPPSSAPLALLLGLTLGLLVGVAGPAAADPGGETARNKAAVSAAFERWRDGTGSPFELLAEDARWTIVGSSPMSRAYATRQAFIDAVITPFNARLSRRLIPEVRRIYADGDTVIVLFDAEAIARDGQPYRNTYTWYLTFAQGRVREVTAFFDTRLFDELWTRVQPTAE